MFLKSHTTQKIAFFLLFLATTVVIVPILLIIGVIVKNGAPAINWEFLTQMPREGMREGGILPAIVGTVCLVTGAIAVALPLGVMAAIYMSEYAGKNLLTRIIKLAIINLAGVPSIVYGLFGLSLFVVYLRFGTSMLSGALTLAIMELPVVITSSREALSSVPMSFREVSLSLGATKWQTVRHAVLPYALPGILTGAILSIARTAGETAPILFTVAAFFLTRLPHSIFDQVSALPYHLYIMSTQIPNVSIHLRYGIALVLIMLVVTMNLLAIVIRWRFRRVKRW
jgi:phosphate transport system permease protein